jgi:hypothetical protein
LKYFYVICPVGADPAFPTKKAILQSLGADRGLESFFPLERHLELSIETVSHDMEAAVFVLADLSLERPSCYFELGIAEATGAPLHLIAAAGTPIHQVGGPRQIAFYSGIEQYRSVVSNLMDSYCGAASRW